MPVVARPSVICNILDIRFERDLPLERFLWRHVCAGRIEILRHRLLPSPLHKAALPLWGHVAPFVGCAFSRAIDQAEYCIPNTARSSFGRTLIKKCVFPYQQARLWSPKAGAMSSMKRCICSRTKASGAVAEVEVEDDPIDSAYRIINLIPRLRQTQRRPSLSLEEMRPVTH